MASSRRRSSFAAFACAFALLTISAPAPAGASTHCCFELAANISQIATLDYGESNPQPYHGDYQLGRYWSVRSIVAFHETAILGRPSLVDMGTEERLVTIEDSSMKDRHAHFENGVYTYTYEPIPCKKAPDPNGSFITQGTKTQPAPVSGGVTLPKTHDGYRLDLNAHTLFDSQPPTCGGSSDLSLHTDQVGTSPVLEVIPPRRHFLQSADAEHDHVSAQFDFPSISITHGGVAGFHTFTSFRVARVRLAWFPESKLDAERQRLRDLKCGLQFCSDQWGR